MDQPSLEQLLGLPGLSPPDGVLPNFDSPPNRNAMSLAVVGIVTVLVAVGVFFRAISMIFYIKKLYVDDVLCFLAFNVNIYVTTYGLTMLFAKPAILLEWIRIFVPYPTRNAFFVTCWILIIINCGYYIAGIFTVNFGCSPREKSWYTWLPGTCIDRKTMDIVSSSINVVSDVAILLLPQKVIWNLNLTAKWKIGISIIFSIGVLACASAIGRIYSTATLDYMGDVTYGVSPALLWGLTEMACVLLVLCFPSAPKIFGQNILRKFALSVRSWTQMPLSSWRRAKNPMNGSFHPTPFGLYGRAGANSDVPLTELENVKSRESTTAVRDYNYSFRLPESEAGIVKTTEFNADTGLAANRSELGRADQMQRQHPWMGN
ncbi:hypothetical protein F4818DRAFT_451951 [Hypoxylon cercidicola]|nr:hypothetical protein F4818DRAFT_451951 [Hypoxylon cercidicola]